MNELDRLEQISKSVEKTTSHLRGISSDLRPYRNLVKVMFIFLFLSLLMFCISVYFGISVYRTSVRSKTEIILEYEEALREDGKTVITEQRLNEYRDYYEFFSDLDEIEDASTKKTFKAVRKSIEAWHKARDKNRKLSKIKPKGK